MRKVEKAFAYITHGGRLLVFRHPNSPKAGIQVPAGTIEPGETLEQAVLREAREETGLTDLVLEAALGTSDFDMSPFGAAKFSADTSSICARWATLPKPGVTKSATARTERLEPSHSSSSGSASPTKSPTSSQNTEPCFTC